MSEAAAVQMPSGIFFTDKGALVVARVAEVIRDAGHVEVGTDGRLWRYHAGVYPPDGEVWVRGRVREALGERCQRKQPVTHVEQRRGRLSGQCVASSPRSA